MGRRFTDSERAALYLAADGRCCECGAELEPSWHADHIRPWSRGGETDVTNGQALCPDCNLRKGNRMTTLRPWQRRMHEKWFATRPQDALISATPGSGKTFAALTLADLLRREDAVDRVVVVAPTDALREQWAVEAAKLGLNLMPVKEHVDYDKQGYDGCVATYAQLAGKAAGSALLRRALRHPTFVILDEIHHAGDNRSWGDALQHAVEPATYRLLLTGTPWRKDRKSPIPFVSYVETDGGHDGPVLTPEVFFAYEYGTAVGDGVCRRVEFHAYDSEVRWVDLGEVQEVQLGEDLDEDHISVVFDAVLNPRHQWIRGLLAKASRALDDLRQDAPFAGGLVVADTQPQAEAYAGILEQITGEHPALAISKDGPKAKADIEAFRNSTSRWLVAVRMVSEGVDIPRLAVGVYATRSRTPLFFRQVVGRFVRIGAGGEHNSLLFIPSVPTLLRHAREIEEELRHELLLAEEREEAERRDAEEAQQTFDLRQILSASDATFHSAILSGDDVTPAELERGKQECRRWDIPVAYAVAVARMLREATTPIDVTVTPKPDEQPRHRVEKLRRDELENLARRFGYKAGVEFKKVNRRIYGVFGPRKSMTVEQLDEAIRLVSKWISELR